MAYSPVLGNPKPQVMDANGDPYVGLRYFFYAAGTSTKVDTQTDSTGSTNNTNPVVFDAEGYPDGNVMIYGANNTGYKVVAAPPGTDDPPTSPLWTIDNIYPGITINGEWINPYDVVYVSATSFKIVGVDVTDLFHIGRRVWLEDTASAANNRYGTISSSVFSTDTTVTVYSITDSTGTAATLHASMDIAYVGVISSGPTTSIAGTFVYLKQFGAVGDGVTDDTAAINNAETIRPAGSTLIWNEGTYLITGNVTTQKAGTWWMENVTINSTTGQIKLNSSNFHLQGNNSIFNYESGGGENRAVRIDPKISAEYGVTGTIAVGDTTFTADDSAEAALLSVNDWILFADKDPTNWIKTEIKQVLSVAGAVVTLTTPFGQDFGSVYTPVWNHLTGALENISVDSLHINIPTTGLSHVGYDAQPGIINPKITNCHFNLAYGLAFSFQGCFNPIAEGNIITNQQQRRSAISFTTGGRMVNNVFKQSDTAISSGGMTIETGTYMLYIAGNEIHNCQAVGFYHNNANHCTYIGNTIIGKDSSAIAIYGNGSSHNSIVGNKCINCSQGVRFITDTAPTTADIDSDYNLIIGFQARNTDIGVAIGANGIGNRILGLDIDPTVTTPIQDSGVDTISDYIAEGTFTPGVSFQTPGDLAVAYTRQVGRYRQSGSRVHFIINILTSSFTHTTAAGDFLITGLPIKSIASDSGVAAMSFAGWTKAGWTQANAAYAYSSTSMQVRITGSGVAAANLNYTSVLTGATLDISISGTYDTD